MSCMRKNVRDRAIRIARMCTNERRPVNQQAHSHDLRILHGVDTKASCLECLSTHLRKERLTRDKTKLLMTMVSWRWLPQNTIRRPSVVVDSDAFAAFLDRLVVPLSGLVLGGNLSENTNGSSCERDKCRICNAERSKRFDHKKKNWRYIVSSQLEQPRRK